MHDLIQLLAAVCFCSHIIDINHPIKYNVVTFLKCEPRKLQCQTFRKEVQKNHTFRSKCNKILITIANWLLPP